MATYSHSKLSSFRNCPYQYKLAYVDRLKTGIENIEAFVGICFHELMEEIFKAGQERHYFLEELHGRFRDLWQKKWHNRIVIPKADKTADDYLRYGEKCVENFYHSYLAPDKGFSSQTVGVEIKIEFPLDPKGKNKMIGYVDRLAKAPDGVYEIQDYKTSASPPDEAELRSSPQLGIYQMGIRYQYEKEGREIPPFRFVLFFVGHAKTFNWPARSGVELSGLMESIQSQICQIENEIDFKARVSPFCQWCSYQALCPEYQQQKSLLR